MYSLVEENPLIEKQNNVMINNFLTWKPF